MMNKKNKPHHFKGKKLSEESKKKISGSIKKGFKEGRQTWNKGIKMWQGKKHPKGMLGKNVSMETRKKRSKSLMGHKVSIETREKISKSHLGMKPSLETKQKISAANIGKKSWNKGKSLEELFGEKKGKQMKKEMSLIKKEYYASNPQAVEAFKILRSKMKIPKKDSSIEIKIQNFLTKLKIEFMAHKYFNLKKSYQCDIYIPSMNLIIEADGDYYHGNPKKYPESQLNKRQREQRERDDSRTKELLEKGYNVIRIWENEIKQMSLKDFENKLMEVTKNV